MVILWLIHAQKLPSLEELCLLDTKPAHNSCGVLVIHSNRTDRSWLSGPRWIIQVSDLSAFDGRVLAYRGSDG